MPFEKAMAQEYFVAASSPTIQGLKEKKLCPRSTFTPRPTQVLLQPQNNTTTSVVSYN